MVYPRVTAAHEPGAGGVAGPRQRVLLPAAFPPQLLAPGLARPRRVVLCLPLPGLSPGQVRD